MKFCSFLLMLVAVGACKTSSQKSTLRNDDAATAASTMAAGQCQGKTVLIVTSEKAYITLADGSQYPTGYFLRELSDPLIALVQAGCKLQFATPNGLAPVIDSNSLELLWAYYPYPELKATAVANRDAAMKMAKAIYGKVHFSVEDERWHRISTEVATYVKAQNENQLGDEVLPSSLAKIADTLEQADAAGAPPPYVGMMVPGGHVPMEDLKVSPAMGRVLKYFHQHRLPTALVCHAPVALIATTQIGDHRFIYANYKVAVADQVAEELLEQMGPLQGYHVAHYVDVDLADAGAKLDQNPWPGYPHVVADQELMTGQNPASAGFLGQMLVEAIGLYSAKNGGDGWWSKRSRYITPDAIHSEQTEATAEEKRLADVAIAANVFRGWVTKSVMQMDSSTPTNLFQDANYLSFFDVAMTVAERASFQGMYPADATPQVSLYRFPLPLMSFEPQLNIFKLVRPLYNYYFPWINGFYDFDSDQFASQLGKQLVR